MNKIKVFQKLRTISIGLSALALAISASLLGQAYNTHAANTLVGTNNQVITIATTDGLAVNAATYPQAYSGDGNVVLFVSSATNLSNAGGSGGLYTYNIKTNTTSRIDQSTNGVQPNGGLNYQLQISETGRYVTFSSNATNLIDGATEPVKVIYKHDTQTGITSVVANGYSGGLGQNQDRNLGISNDGQFSLIASRYIANGYPYPYGIALGNGASGTYSWTSLAKGNDIEGSNSGTDVVGDMSCDGSFAVYDGTGPKINLVDLRQGSVVTVATGSSNSISPIISCNGRYVLYATQDRTDITPTPSGLNSNMHLVRYDRITGERMYIDSNSSGVFSTGFGYSPLNEPSANVFNASIADSGDVVFQYGSYEYLKHLSDGSGTLESIGITTSGSYINIAGSLIAQISQNGRYIFFSADPYSLGLAPSPSSNQLIRTKTNL